MRLSAPLQLRVPSGCIHRDVHYACKITCESRSCKSKQLHLWLDMLHPARGLLARSCPLLSLHCRRLNLCLLMLCVLVSAMACGPHFSCPLPAQGAALLLSAHERPGAKKVTHEPGLTLLTAFSVPPPAGLQSQAQQPGASAVCKHICAVSCTPLLVVGSLSAMQAHSMCQACSDLTCLRTSCTCILAADTWRTCTAGLVMRAIGHPLGCSLAVMASTLVQRLRQVTCGQADQVLSR